MAKGAIAQHVEQVFKLVDSLAKDAEKRLDEQFRGEPFGAHSPKPEEIAGFVQMMLRKYPPQVWIAPDGHAEMNSAWFIAVREGYVEGGARIWRQIERSPVGEAARAGQGVM